MGKSRPGKAKKPGRRSDQGPRLGPVSLLLTLAPGVSLPDALERIARTTAGIPLELLVAPIRSSEALPEVPHETGCALLPVQENHVDAWNALLERASHDWSVILDGRLQVREGWLGALLKAARRSPNRSIVGSRLLSDAGCLTHAGIEVNDSDGVSYRMSGQAAGYFGALQETTVVAVDCSLALLKVKDVRAFGGFDETMSPFYASADLCLRARSAGAATTYCPTSTALDTRPPRSTDWATVNANDLFEAVDEHERFWGKWTDGGLEGVGATVKSTMTKYRQKLLADAATSLSEFGVRDPSSLLSRVWST